MSYIGDFETSIKLEAILSGNIYCSVPCVADAYRKGLNESHVISEYKKCNMNDITPEDLCRFVSSSDIHLSSLGRQIVKNLITSSLAKNDQSAVKFVQETMNLGLLEIMIRLIRLNYDTFDYKKKTANSEMLSFEIS